MAVLTVACFLAFRKECPAKPTVEQRNGGGKRSQLHARKRLRGLQCAPLKFLCAGGIIIQRSKIKGQHGEVVRVKA